MECTLVKTLSASCKAHAVLHWTIADARSMRQLAEEFLESEHISFSDFGFGASSLRWSLMLELDCQYDDKKDGDLSFVGLFLCLTSGDVSGTNVDKVQASYSLEVFLPKSDSWEAIRDDAEAEFDAEIDWSWGCQKAFSRVLLFGDDSLYVSDDGAMIMRAVVDFEIAGNSASHHPAALCARMADLHVSKDFSDFVLVSSDEISLPVHRVILAAQSSVFRGMFEHGTKEQETGRAEIKDVSGEILNIVIRYMYSGDVKGVQGAAEKVMEASDKYDVSDLKDLAVRHLCEGGITLENAYRLSVAADQRKLSKLRLAVSEFIVGHWASLRGTSEFVEYRDNHGHMFAVLETACRSKKHPASAVAANGPEKLATVETDN